MIRGPVEPQRHRHRVSVRRPIITNQGGVPVDAQHQIVEPSPTWAFVQEAPPGNVLRVFAAQVQALSPKVVEMRYRTIEVGDVLIWHDHNDQGDVRDRTMRVMASVDPDGTRQKVLVAAVESS